MWRTELISAVIQVCGRGGLLLMSFVIVRLSTPWFIFSEQKSILLSDCRAWALGALLHVAVLIFFVCTEQLVFRQVFSVILFQVSLVLPAVC